MFSIFNFSSIFPGGSADPICPYVPTETRAAIVRGRGWQVAMLVSVGG